MSRTATPKLKRGESRSPATKQKSRLSEWRKRLKSKDTADLIPQAAIDELFAIAKQQVEFYYRRPKRLSSTAISRELSQLAKGLMRAEKAIQALGAQGVAHIYAASRASSDIDDFIPLLQSAHLISMSRLAKRAAETARDEKNSHVSAKRGPTADLNLRGLVTILAQQYVLLLSVQATHTAHVQTGEGTSLFDDFVKAAFSDFAPAEKIPEWGQIDEAIRQELPYLRHFSTHFRRSGRPSKIDETPT